MATYRGQTLGLLRQDLYNYLLVNAEKTSIASKILPHIHFQFCWVFRQPLVSTFGQSKACLVHATPLSAGFVDIFIGQMHSESGNQIQ